MSSLRSTQGFCRRWNSLLVSRLWRWRWWNCKWFSMLLSTFFLFFVHKRKEEVYFLKIFFLFVWLSWRNWTWNAAQNLWCSFFTIVCQPKSTLWRNFNFQKQKNKKKGISHSMYFCLEKSPQNLFYQSEEKKLFGRVLLKIFLIHVQFVMREIFSWETWGIFHLKMQSCIDGVIQSIKDLKLQNNFWS